MACFPVFVGRQEELQRLDTLWKQERPGIGVVFGRRRIGKTELIRKSLEGRDALWFDGIENRPKSEQLDAFLLQAKEQTNRTPEEPVKKWREAFLLLVDELKTRPRPVVLDEFQWMANYRSEIVADLKLIWDRYWSRIPGVTLILCGSIASFMVERVVRSQALYGRANTVIHLKPFSLAESFQLLSGRGWEEILEAQMLVGGVPQYLEFLRGFSSVRIAMEKEAFRPFGYFASEYGRIFVSHFGKNPQFEKIVRALARHPHGLYRKDIARKTGIEPGGQLTTCLRDLESAGFLHSFRPIDKGPRSKILKHILADAYLRFYFSFIEPNLSKIEAANEQSRLFQRLSLTGEFRGWLGVAFEHLCREHASRISKILGFPGIDYICGPYLRPPRAARPGLQVDLLFDRADHVLTFCEMKYQIKPVGASVLGEIRQRASLLESAFPGKTIQPVLIVKQEVTREIASSSEIFQIIRAEELF